MHCYFDFQSCLKQTCFLDSNSLTRLYSHCNFSTVILSFILQWIESEWKRTFLRDQFSSISQKLMQVIYSYLHIWIDRGDRQKYVISKSKRSVQASYIHGYIQNESWIILESWFSLVYMAVSIPGDEIAAWILVMVNCCDSIEFQFSSEFIWILPPPVFSVEF